MALIVVLPSAESDACAARIFSMLRRRMDASLISRGECSACCDAGLWLVSTHPGQRIELGEGSILVCLEDCAQTILARRAHLLLAEGVAVPAGVLAAQIISIGRGSKNTITVSSLQGERAMISLQRTITSLAGERIEPCEYPLALPGETSLTEALTAAAILLLCGEGNQTP